MVLVVGDLLAQSISGPAPCQCHLPDEVVMTSPDQISLISPPRNCTSPPALGNSFLEQQDGFDGGSGAGVAG